MATFNGIGTMYYGWSHFDNDESIATKWFTVFFMPLIPLYRERLIVLNDFEKQKFIEHPSDVLLAFSPIIIQEDYYRIIEKLSLDWKAILITYLKAYFFLPLLTIWPLIFIPLMAKIKVLYPEFSDTQLFKYIAIILAGICLINAISVPVWALQRARGYKGGLFSKKPKYKQVIN